MEKNEKCNCHAHSYGMFGGFYGLGFIATMIYYLQHADTFGMSVLGILKALVWPAMLIYKIFTLLKM